MKKVLVLLIICLVCSASADAVTKKKKKRTSSFNYYEKQYISSYGWGFKSSDGSLEGWGSIHIECDKNKRVWFRYECGGVLSSVEKITDGNGREWLGKYNVYKGKHMYLKLDNDEIITLTCKDIEFIHNGYFTGNTDIYKEYQIFSYFDLTQDVINKLNEHKIVKMRCELRYEVLDMVLEEDIDLKPKFEEAFNELGKKMEEETQKNDLKSNPLNGF